MGTKQGVGQGDFITVENYTDNAGLAILPALGSNLNENIIDAGLAINKFTM